MLIVTTDTIPGREMELLGVDAIVAMRFATSSVTQSAAEIMAYGTAVKFR